ncbi:hypothetical protein DTO96_102187 [Ephemeroptericola cinctiostellae]|uniref:Uncharacterized protein n=1 Tax=Ephemeroptericola cinctiostellae TaxID=2268024 RepID=A0A345DDJ5_9BURK|nr:DUF1804 family protein [Ephemeroptericola cinctiostellae]AXF86433.1 hypothetical protein DTO96_102187 [Ephemeroptericola cinctiostellae]
MSKADKTPQKPDRAEMRTKVRAGYVQGTDLTIVAAGHGVPYATAVSWKRADKERGDDWDTARRARQMAGAGAQEMFGQILEEVGAQYISALDLVKKDEKMSPAVRGELLVKMVDGLSKAAKLAGLVSPEVNELATAMKVIRLQNEYIAEHHPEMRLPFVDMMSEFGIELPRLLGVQ